MRTPTARGRIVPLGGAFAEYALDVTGAGSAPRRRRGVEAEQLILERARALLLTRPLREVTVDELMAGTSLSRPAFYQYFRDLGDLVLRVLARSEARLNAASRLWTDGDGDPAADLRAALRASVSLYDEEGPVLLALLHASSRDGELDAAYHAMVARFARASAARIEREIAAGRVAPLDAYETALALVWMNERYLAERLGREPKMSAESVVEVLHAIWVRVLFGGLEPALALDGRLDRTVVDAALGTTYRS